MEDDVEQGDNAFDQKTEKGSSDLYFHYYGQLQHQQNMLQDYIRTGTYYEAITENRSDFEGKTVMDVGAGSGILSLFAAQAGARRVYAVEASEMAQYARILADSNPAFGPRIDVKNKKIEELKDIEKVDVLVSEPMGTLLVNERMLETYLYARDQFLKPGGLMFPQIGRIHVALFSDDTLHMEMQSKGAFWLQKNFYGVDISSMYPPSVNGYFSQVVVDAIDPSVLVSTFTTKTFDFATISEKDLHNFDIPIALQTEKSCDVHGLAMWFDVLFPGSTNQRWLSTAPGMPITHWFHLRCVLRCPLSVKAAGMVTGNMKLVAHERQSYDIFLDLAAAPLHPGLPPQQASGKLDLKDPFYRQMTSWNAQAQTAPSQNPMPPVVSEQTTHIGHVAESPVYDLHAEGDEVADLEELIEQDQIE